MAAQRPSAARLTAGARIWSRTRKPIDRHPYLSVSRPLGPDDTCTLTKGNMMRGTSRRLQAATAGAAATLLIAAAPASDEADSEPSSAAGDHCVFLTVYVGLLGGPREYLLGPDHCALGTPWTGPHVTVPVEVEVIEDGPEIVEAGVIVKSRTP